MQTALDWIAHSGVVQGVIIGAALSYLTAVLIMNIVIRSITTTVNGWSIITRCGRPENGVFLRAACAKALPMVNVVEESAYWTATKDAAGRRLDGRHDYVLRFPAGQLPPNDAFWSLSVTDTTGYMTTTAHERSSIDDRGALVTNADGAVDVHFHQHAPTAGEENWLAVPPGRFKLMLRAYLPGAAVLDGTYQVPAIVKAD